MTQDEERTWWTPGRVEVTEGIHRIPLPMPTDGLRAINVYALVTNEGIDLIDSGWAIPEAREVLITGLRELGATLTDVNRILVTHVHHDHFTQAIHVRRESGATVALGQDERASLEAMMGPADARDQRQRRLVQFMGAESRAADYHMTYDLKTEDWELPDEWLNDSQTLNLNGRELEVVTTPGHTQGHVVFHDNDHRLLFTGDHILPTITPSIGLEPDRAPNPLGDFLNSLAKVRARPDAMQLPAHGKVTDSVHSRIDELAAHHVVRLADSVAVVQAGASTAYEVAHGLHWTRRETAFDDLDHRNQWLAVCETAAHLNLLVAQGRAAAVTEDDVRHYSADASPIEA